MSKLSLFLALFTLSSSCFGMLRKAGSDALKAGRRVVSELGTAGPRGGKRPPVRPARPIASRPGGLIGPGAAAAPLITAGGPRFDVLKPSPSRGLSLLAEKERRERNLLLQAGEESDGDDDDQRNYTTQDFLQQVRASRLGEISADIKNLDFAKALESLGGGRVVNADTNALLGDVVAAPNAMFQGPGEWRHQDVGARDQLIDLLLAANANLNGSRNGTPYVMHALSNLKFDVAQKLLDAGADPLAVDAKGNSVLHNAVGMMAYGAPVNLVQRLIDAGADVNKANASGETPLVRLVRELGYFGQNYTDPDLRNYRYNSQEDSQRYLEHLAQSSRGYAPELIDGLRLLLDRGADTSMINLENAELADAIRELHPEVRDLLTSYGANV